MVESRPIYVLYGQSTYVQRKVRLFVDFLEERVQGCFRPRPMPCRWTADPSGLLGLSKKAELSCAGGRQGQVRARSHGRAGGL